MGLSREKESENQFVFFISSRMRPKKMKDEEGARTIACPHKVSSEFIFEKQVHSDEMGVCQKQKVVIEVQPH